jgi:hypothetical protein
MTSGPGMATFVPALAGRDERGRRILMTVAVTIVTAAFVWTGKSPPAAVADCDYVWYAARALLRGVDPYAAVVAQPGLHYPLFYPATAPVLAAPLGALPLRLASTVFLAGGMGALAWVWSREPWRLWGLSSAPALNALLLCQWSPWLTAAVGLPWLSVVWAAKPSVGLAYVIGWPSRRAFGLAAALTAVSFLVVPGWPTEWISAVRDAPYYLAPIQRPFGWVLLLAWVRWRRPEARFLGTLACVPHSSSLYEILPLLLVARNRRELAGLMALTFMGWALLLWRVPVHPLNVPPVLAAQWPYLLLFGYLPPMLLLIRQPARGASVDLV